MRKTSRMPWTERPARHLADVAERRNGAGPCSHRREGDSAGGSCKQAHNNGFHPILPLRGKILNTERARLNRALSNAEIKSVVSAVGGGIARDFQVEDMRYAGIAIFVDADVDGLHITTLLLTLFWRFMRPMIDAGRLYVARAPALPGQQGQAEQYAYTGGGATRSSPALASGARASSATRAWAR
ncbi:MAG: hypothetical protein IPG72_14435 [Ardenticatenales bacterium]|nr:hypothetical protein [Ardenticatenales bacterium]